MRKIFTFLFAALMSVGMWAEPIEVVWNSYDIPTVGSGNSFTKDGVTVTCGGIDWDYPDFYNGGTFTTDLGNFTHIYVYASDINMSGNGWSGTTHQQTWTGNAASVSFEGSMHSISDIWFYIEPASTPEPEPAGQVITWDNDFCSNVIACFDSWEWQHVEANNTKDGITVTYSNSNDYGWKVGTIDLYVQENILTFTSTVGDISKIEVYYSANYGSTPNGWTLDATNKKFVWEGTAAAAVDMVGGYVYFMVDHIVFTIGAAAPTAVENVQTNPVQATKFFRDGMLLIEKNGKIYNATGAEVK